MILMLLFLSSGCVKSRREECSEGTTIPTAANAETTEVLINETMLPEGISVETEEENTNKSEKKEHMTTNSSTMNPTEAASSITESPFIPGDNETPMT